jgi:hypothetical protein
MLLVGHTKPGEVKESVGLAGAATTVPFWRRSSILRFWPTTSEGMRHVPRELLTAVKLLQSKRSDDAPRITTLATRSSDTPLIVTVVVPMEEQNAVDGCTSRPQPSTT